MNKIILLTVFLCTISFSSYADKRGALLQVIDEEIGEVSRLSKQSKGRNPRLLLRLAELNLEKARHLKERENDKYLRLSVSQKRTVNRKKFFSKSKAYFNKAQSICKSIIGKFKKFSGKGEVYYIMAFNSKEFKEFKKARQYLQYSIKYSKPKSKVRVKSQSALAELYFSDGKYGLAAPLYERALPYQKDSTWWTKDSYNLAWCYYRKGKFNRAIAKMKEVYAKSKSGKYVDMSSKVADDLAAFYAAAGKPQQGIKFYKSTGGNITKKLITLGKLQSDKGQKTNSQKTFSSAKKTTNNPEEILEINLALLALYEKFNDYSNHLKVSKEINAYHKVKPLKNEDLKVFKYQLDRMSAFLQKQVVSKHYKNVKKVRIRKAKLAGEYFEILGSITGKVDYKKIFLKGETHYSAKSYGPALDSYFKTLTYAENAKDTKYIKLSLKGLLAVLGMKGLSRSLKNKHLLPVYLRYLKFDPKSKRAESIYQKVFKIYTDKKDTKNSEKVLYSYKANFSGKLKIQEAMLAQIMEKARKEKNVKEIRKWVNRINKGEFKVSKKYADNLNKLLLKYQFSRVESANTKGDKKFALQEYFKIYNNPKSELQAKKNSAYNMAVLYYELGRPDESILWQNKSVDMMNGRELLRFQSTFLLMINSLFHRQRFKSASDLSYKIFKKVCKLRKSKKGVFYKNAVILAAANGETEKVLAVADAGKKCGIPYSLIVNSYVEILKMLEKSKRWGKYSEVLEYLESSNKNWGSIIKPYFNLLRAYKISGRKEEAAQIRSKIMRLYKFAKRERQEIPLEGLDVVAHYKLLNLEREIKKLYAVKLQYPEKRFNARLKNKLTQLDRVTSKGLEILKIGSGIGIVKSYQYLVESYQRVVQEIRDFTPPKKSKQYTAGFKKSMSSLTQPLLKRSFDFIKESKGQIKKSQILSRENYWFFSSERLPIKVDYSSRLRGIIMDRGGKR
ncbi:MAG: tetratricopeptide repeat protein [Bacteriovoracaceae bacterium]|jgi:tetratricopeptide (TPR) repeat protein|nr:tetratricopeptide repeat protein [Bacteriovoracaceae bacterium]